MSTSASLPVVGPVGDGADTSLRFAKTPEFAASAEARSRCVPRPRKGSHSPSGGSEPEIVGESPVGRVETSGARTVAIPHGANGCLLYTSDAADDLLCVDLGG